MRCMRSRTALAALVASLVTLFPLFPVAASAHVYSCSVSAKTPDQYSPSYGYISYAVTVTCNEVQAGTDQDLDFYLQQRYRYSDGTYSNWESVDARTTLRLGSYTVSGSWDCPSGRGAQYRTRAQLYYWHGTSGSKASTSGYRYITCY